jgi:prophage regulatory protein
MKELILREAKVKETTGLSKNTRWRLEKAGEFPQKIQLGPRAVGWRAEEIIQCCEDRCQAKNEPVGKHKGESGPTNPGGPREAS